MHVGNRKLANERNPRTLYCRAFYAQAAERIWPVEHDELDMVFGRGFHAFRHRADVSVRSTTDVLDVECENVHAVQHRRGRFSRRAVKRVGSQTGHGIATRLHVAARLLLAVESMLWRVERDEIAMFTQQNACPITMRIDARLVRD